MAAANGLSLNPIYKTLFPSGLPATDLYEANPSFGLLKKNPRFGGDGVKIPVMYRGGVNVGRTLADAKTHGKPVGYRAFRILDTDLTTRFGTCQWDRQAMLRASMGGELSFVQGVEAEIKGKAYDVANMIAHGLWSDGGGSVGRISATSNTGTPTITLANPDDIVNFEEGMVLQAADANPAVSGSGNIRTGTATIAGLDRAAGTITLSGNWTASLTSVAANDFLFPVGMIDANAYTVGGYGTKGFPAWVPDTAPVIGGPTFYTVQRGADSTRLSGCRYNGTGGSVVEAVQILGTLLKREGQSVDTCFIHPKNWYRLMVDATSKTVFTVNPEVGGKKAKFGYEAFSIATAAGTVKVIADPKVRPDRVYLFKMDAWTLYSTGKCPDVVMDDGKRFDRLESENTFELRIVADYVLACHNPAAQGVAQISLPGF